MTHRAECGGMRFWFQMGWVPCIQSRSCRLQCYNPGSFKPSGRSNSHLSTRQSICASRGRCSLGSLASTLVLGFWAFQLTKKPFDPTVSEVHGGIDNVPVSLLLRMYNISQVSNLVSSCPGCKTQQDWHAPAIVQLSLLRCVLAVTMTTREADPRLRLFQHASPLSAAQRDLSFDLFETAVAAAEARAEAWRSKPASCRIWKISRCSYFFLMLFLGVAEFCCALNAIIVLNASFSTFVTC